MMDSYWDLLYGYTRDKEDCMRPAVLGLLTTAIVGCSDCPPNVPLSDSGRVIKISIEPDASCGSRYRVFLTGSKFSMHELCADEVSLAVGDPSLEVKKEIKETSYYRHYAIHCAKTPPYLKDPSKLSPKEKWECAYMVSAKLTLPSCSSYRDTLRYVVKESSSQSSSHGSGLLGLVYSSSSSSSSSSKEYQLRDEDLVMPCIRD